ncbi:uncharacterized protein EI90DRAFT_3011740 [Cantharellus anzutake]|uniref:uncharacterized protein n=1 Tax=Cantharellus anzutake TaxID=1750568 RepID=UPI001905FA4E|nr:uncharacterized protein EI90DRAFT_3011740 [Cantharellus anzutake]KAF8342226.1 hypothetical protein EI90DRAFT_3011740 [Cantharellus anzutake]
MSGEHHKSDSARMSTSTRVKGPQPLPAKRSRVFAHTGDQIRDQHGWKGAPIGEKYHPGVKSAYAPYIDSDGWGSPIVYILGIRAIRLLRLWFYNDLSSKWGILSSAPIHCARICNSPVIAPFVWVRLVIGACPPHKSSGMYHQLVGAVAIEWRANPPVYTGKIYVFIQTRLSCLHKDVEDGPGLRRDF